jgi:2-oxoglutarate ferredoxin oxidoreductase subunit delta
MLDEQKGRHDQAGKETDAMKDDVQAPKLLASEDEVRVNGEALARREMKEPSGKKHRITLRPFYCKGCGLCVDICPTGVLLLSGNKRSKWGITVIKSAPDFCIGCRMCEHRCPDFAILIDYGANVQGKKPERGRTHGASRG